MPKTYNFLEVSNCRESQRIYSTLVELRTPCVASNLVYRYFLKWIKIFFKICLFFIILKNKNDKII